MAFLFKSKKSPTELVKSLQKNLAEMVDEKSDEKTVKKCVGKVTEYVTAIKVTFYGDGESEPKKDASDKLVDAILASDVLITIIQRLPSLEFEARKDITQIYTYIFRHRRDDAAAFVMRNQTLLSSLISGYCEAAVALTCGSILREALRSEELSMLVLATPAYLDPLFALLHVSVFDVALDAFATFTALLTKHKKSVCKYLEANFDTFFAKYSKLLSSTEYVTCRLSLKLLASLLLSRENFPVMMRFIALPEHLKTTMTLLRAPSKSTQTEAFHVFKIFVANPKKSEAVQEILYRNRAKLLTFLASFQKDRDDEQFIDEKNILIHSLESMPPPPSVAAAAQAAAAVDPAPQRQ